jgi:RsiW-degrading membrane proteinase PrsW (M82 family)
MLQEFFKYASVRYTVFFSREFDEPLDGIVYCTAAGLGLSAMLNFFYVLDHQGVNLSYGLSRMFINSLAHACFAAVTGYFLGLTRFRPCQVKVTLGLLMAVLCNGCFFFLLEKVSYVGFNISITNGLALAAVFCGALLAIIFNLIHKAQVDPDAWRCEPEGTT